MPIRFNPDHLNKDLTCNCLNDFCKIQISAFCKISFESHFCSSCEFEKFVFNIQLKEIAWKNIDKELLLWSLYVEKLLGKIFDPEFLNTFYAIDNLLKFEDTQNPYYLQYWADIAFIRWSIFPGKQKMIRKKDYLDIAKHLYYSRYKHTENLIWKILYWNLEFYAQKLEKFLRIQNF